MSEDGYEACANGSLLVVGDGLDASAVFGQRPSSGHAVLEVDRGCTMSHVSIFRASAPPFRLVSLPKQPRPVPPRAGVCYAYHSGGCRDFAHSREWSEGCRGSQGSPLPVMSRRQPAVPSRLSHTASHVQQRTAFSSVSACRRWSASVARVASMRLLKPAASILNHKQQRSRAPTSDALAVEMVMGGKGGGIARLLGSLCGCTGAGVSVVSLSNNMRDRVVGCD